METLITVMVTSNETELNLNKLILTILTSQEIL